MTNFAVKKSSILTDYDIDNLYRKFGGANQSYIEIVNVMKNKSTIDKYPLLKDISLSITDTVKEHKINKSTY
ncbi:BcsR/BcsP family cellulose biosynthesis protein [Pseudoalteromonas rhizosphaerae]|uniref:BcsR/BcsP family cellulose biosynthesis protein n=1 Tax=Pseudoalteromonas rhizosphaerae TaxID=2518973 RepID=UPI00123092A5|nr:BcsR/BcsP family cellulose biosynthesis protein [Pseudoalteromonas rhizosphaerae]